MLVFIVPVALAIITMWSLYGRRDAANRRAGEKQVQIFARAPQKPLALNKRIAAISSLLASLDGGIAPQLPSPADPGAPPAPRTGGTLRGLVVDHFGGTPGACTVFMRPSQAGMLEQHSAFSGSVRGGADGVVTAEGISPGAYDLLARCERGMGRLRNVSVAAEGISDFGSLRLDGGSTLRGTVVESGAKKAVAGAAITVYSPYPNKETPEASTLFSGSSDRDGRFEFENVPEGKWHLKIDADGFLGKDLVGLSTPGRGVVDLGQVFLVRGSLETLHESSQFGGIGVTIGRNKGDLKVMAVIDGTPAKNAGLVGGDTILEVNGLPAADLSLDEAIGSIRGDERTSVRLKIRRGGRTFETEIVRDTIKPE